MYMQKKIYVAPNFEVIYIESEPLLDGSITTGVGGPDGETTVGGGTDMGTNKKQYGFNNAPWE